MFRTDFEKHSLDLDENSNPDSSAELSGNGPGIDLNGNRFGLFWTKSSI